MKSANKEMKKQYKNIDIDKIEVRRRRRRRLSRAAWRPFADRKGRPRPHARAPQSIHYDMEDLIDQANEIQESLGRSYGVPEEIDEADLQAGKPPPPRRLGPPPPFVLRSTLTPTPCTVIATELDALADESYAEVESEGAVPSYLRDTAETTLPDFVDADPVAEQVRLQPVSRRASERGRSLTLPFEHPQHAAQPEAAR